MSSALTPIHASALAGIRAYRSAASGAKLDRRVRAASAAADGHHRSQVDGHQATTQRFGRRTARTPAGMLLWALRGRPAGPGRAHLARGDGLERSTAATGGERPGSNRFGCSETDRESYCIATRLGGLRCAKYAVGQHVYWFLAKIGPCVKKS